MFNAQQPTEKDLPTSTQLLKSTIIAIIVAIILLVTIKVILCSHLQPGQLGHIIIIY